MSKVTIEIVEDQIDSIVVQQMKMHLEIAKGNLKRRKENQMTNGFYDRDKKKDMILLKKDIESFEHVLSYYGVEV